MDGLSLGSVGWASKQVNRFLLTVQYAGKDHVEVEVRGMKIESLREIQDDCQHQRPVAHRHHPV